MMQASIATSPIHPPPHQSLDGVVNTFGSDLKRRFGGHIHKLALDAGLSCPNRDGSRGIGGCTFCNHRSFSPPGSNRGTSIDAQIDGARRSVLDKTGARRYLAYFQAYTNTHAEIRTLRQLYEQALQRHDVIGLSIGTRPDCVAVEVLDLLLEFQDRGLEIWLELGLQSSFDKTLQRIRRGHGMAEYRSTVLAARNLGLKVCTHLIVGLPGETPWHARASLERVVELGVDGLKLHPLHVVRGTQIARDWHRGRYQCWDMERYVDTAVEMIRRTPAAVVYHRVSATAQRSELLAPDWCTGRWKVVNAITRALYERGGQGSAVATPVPGGPGRANITNLNGDTDSCT